SRRQGLAISLLAMFLIFASCFWLSSTGDDFDYFRLTNSLSPHHSIRSQNHVFHLVFENGRFGPGAGILFECGPLGLVCRAVHVETWGTESGLGSPKMHLESDSTNIFLKYSDQLLYSYRIGAAAN